MNFDLSKAEKKIGYSFQNKALLLQSLTHSSYAYEAQDSDQDNNEVLEFLGDSVLGFLLADFLCSMYPDLSEGELSKLKSAIGSTMALSSFARKIKLDKLILLGKGEEKSGGRKKRTILAAALEAVIAAVYLDGGIDAARDFTTRHFRAFVKKINVAHFFINNYKSALQEHLQKENAPPPLYRTITSKGPDHKKRFIVEVSYQDRMLARASGQSKKEAEQKAAQKAMKILLGTKMKTLTADMFLVKKKKK